MDVRWLNSVDLLIDRLMRNRIQYAIILREYSVVYEI